MDMTKENIHKVLARVQDFDEAADYFVNKMFDDAGLALKLSFSEGEREMVKGIVEVYFAKAYVEKKGLH